MGCDDHINILMVPNVLAGSRLRMNTSRRVVHAMSTLANTILSNALGTPHLHGVVSTFVNTAYDCGCHSHSMSPICSNSLACMLT